jgi:hypothetical protein
MVCGLPGYRIHLRVSVGCSESRLSQVGPAGKRTGWVCTARLKIELLRKGDLTGASTRIS